MKGPHFSLWVDYHYRGANLYTFEEFEPYEFGDYDDCAAAQAACREMVSEYIQDCAQPGVSVQKLMDKHAAEGIVPQVLRDGASSGECTFSASEYALQRARELAGDLWNEDD